ncbi:hypothetical protein [Lysobacter sp. FW306-1B-D06B]|uniref:hypothetical protein n=1 Tax=Lysobacter sp. FW306-1B-D06B TaxID=3140250 RepID=UPI003140C31E
MNLRPLALSAVLSSFCLLAACGANPSGQQQAQQKAEQTGGVISGAVQKALTEAKKEIAEGNINIDNGKTGKRVELSPKGDFIVDGKPVPVTPEQRALLLEYRSHVVAVATAGMNIGMHSADLATHAVTESIKSVFTGGSDDIDEKVKAQASKVEAAALQLCNALPGMMTSQDRLAAALPEFKPYANLTQSDIDECVDEAKEKSHKLTADAAAEAAKASEAPSKQ